MFGQDQVRKEEIEHSIELIEVLAWEGRKMRLIFWQGQGLEEDIELLPGATAPGSDELAPGSDEFSPRSDKLAPEGCH